MGLGPKVALTAGDKACGLHLNQVDHNPLPGNEAPAKARAGRWLLLLLSWETASVETVRNA